MVHWNDWFMSALNFVGIFLWINCKICGSVILSFPWVMMGVHTACVGTSYKNAGTSNWNN